MASVLNESFSNENKSVRLGASVSRIDADHTHMPVLQLVLRSCVVVVSLFFSLTLSASPNPPRF
jgi:hypothetical protein